MTRIRSVIAERPVAAALWIGALTTLLLLAFFGIAQATESPSFCDTCHEMEPYHAAWSVGPHADVACVDCHVDAGLPARLSHKFVALGEVWSHVAGDPTFPLPEPTLVPNERCTACHGDIESSATGFDHDLHARDRECTECHEKTGHAVTDAALISAGIYNSENAALRSANVVAARGSGADNVKGHVSTDCASCHDMEATGCSSCHEPGHDPREQSCTRCHAPGETWVFAHPADGSCSECHEPAAEHTSSTGEAACETCHSERGVSWAFAHPDDPACESCHARPAEHRGGECQTCHTGVESEWKFTHPSSANCTDCHAKPARHRSGSCTTCHAAGVSWAFRHPGSGSTCTNCHTKPAGHRSGSCTTCHGTGTSWAFSHPGSGSTCTSCHARPAGHSGAACTSCHSVGSSWAFKHPTSSACASCHSAPSSHYGTACASCHTPAKAWRSATFSHPRIPGGEHTNRSFACSKCHPSGYSSASCTSCHSSNNPDGDDD